VSNANAARTTCDLWVGCPIVFLSTSGVKRTALEIASKDQLIKAAELFRFYKMRVLRAEKNKAQEASRKQHRDLMFAAATQLELV